MSVLLLGPETPEARFNDLDYARCVEAYGGRVVHRLDPEAVYRERGMKGLEQALLVLVRERQVEMLIYGLGIEFDFRPAFLHDDLAHLYRVLILGDDEYYFDVSHRYYAQCFDLVLTNNPLCERYRLYGIDALFLPNVFSPALFHPAPQPRKDIDVSFIGAMRGKVGREGYARALESAGIAVSLFGAGTPAGIVGQAEVIDIYRRSRINLNFTAGNVATPLDRHLSIHRRVRQVKGRCSKIALCGSFVLSEHAPGIEMLFEVGHEIDVFRDERDLVAKARHYLARETEREAMAARAYQRALAQYDEAKFWTSMAETLRLRAARKRAARRLPLYLDRPFLSAFGAWRFKYLVVFLFTGRLRLLLDELGLLARTGRFTPSAAIAFAGAGLHGARGRSRAAALVATVVVYFRRRLKGVR